MALWYKRNAGWVHLGLLTAALPVGILAIAVYNDQVLLSLPLRVSTNMLASAGLGLEVVRRYDRWLKGRGLSLQARNRALADTFTRKGLTMVICLGQRSPGHPAVFLTSPPRISVEAEVLVTIPPRDAVDLGRVLLASLEANAARGNGHMEGSGRE